MSLYCACVGSNLICTAKYIQEIKFRSHFLFRAWLYPFSKNTCLTWHITSKFWIVCVNCTTFYLLTITTNVEMSIDPQLTNICVVHVDWNVCVYMHTHLFNLVTVKTCIRERPFNLKGGGSKNIFWFPMLLKKIFWFWWSKKKIIWFRVFVI